MKRRRSLAVLEAAVEAASTRRHRALALLNLGLFHDNNSREARAIPYYRRALRLGLEREARAQALAWLASSLYKTGHPRLALSSLRKSRSATRDTELREFLDGLERRVRRA
jgi:tetratricopeptide (TPR) repeat protein